MHSFCMPVYPVAFTPDCGRWQDGAGTEVIHAEFSNTPQPQLGTSEKAKQRPEKNRQRSDKSKKQSEKTRPLRANSSSDEEEDEKKDSGRPSLQESGKSRAGLTVGEGGPREVLGTDWRRDP